MTPPDVPAFLQVHWPEKLCFVVGLPALRDFEFLLFNDKEAVTLTSSKKILDI